MNMSSSENCCSEKTCNPESKETSLHIAIIGSGSAAFAAAIKATEAGARVTMIEANDVIGGCCVNVGCVPSKILIRAAQLAQEQRDNPFVGLKNHEPTLDRKLISGQQQGRVDELRRAKYEQILENNPNIQLVKGFARFVDKNTLVVKRNKAGIESEKTISADKILIVTGSKPTIPPIPGLADTAFWTSTEALFSETLPESMVVLGSSVVAVELAQAYQRLGTKVTLLARHSLLYREDELIGIELKKIFQKQGMTVLEYTQADSVSFEDNLFTIKTADKTIHAEKLLVSTGRGANTSGLNLDAIGVETDRNGRIIVNDKMETSVNGIYAAGDCTQLPQFVYVAAAAGARAGSNMTGGDETLDLSAMPTVIFTDPQVATVGYSEAEAREKGIATISRVLDLENVPRALANFDTDGFIKIVAEKSSKKIIGVQILAHDGGEIIQTAVLAISHKMTVDDLAAKLFPYLTMAEGLKLCAQTFSKDVKSLSCCAA